MCLCVAVPRVRSMSRSQTVVAGSELELECRVWGWPVPVVTWQRLGSLGDHSRVPLNFVDDDRLSLRPGVAMAPPGVTVDNATLVISNVKYSDRDTYVCDVTSYVNGSWRTDNSTVLVRVKGETISSVLTCTCHLTQVCLVLLSLVVAGPTAPENLEVWGSYLGLGRVCVVLGVWGLHVWSARGLWPACLEC